MAHILLLPTEMLHHILSYVNPEDLGALPLTCKGLNSFVKANKALYRDIYLRHLVRRQPHSLLWLVIPAEPRKPTTIRMTPKTRKWIGRVSSTIS